MLNEFEYDIEWRSSRRQKTETDKSVMEITKSIIDVYTARFAKIRRFFFWLNYVSLPISFLLIVIGSYRYLKNYLVKDRYQNYVMG